MNPFELHYRDRVRVNPNVSVYAGMTGEVREIRRNGHGRVAIVGVHFDDASGLTDFAPGELERIWRAR